MYCTESIKNLFIMNQPFDAPPGLLFSEWRTCYFLDGRSLNLPSLHAALRSMLALFWHIAFALSPHLRQVDDLFILRLPPVLQD